MFTLVINQLKCFIAAAETLHFGRAAQSLDMLPDSLGRHIKQLEDQLDVRLFQRTTRSVALTEIGTSLLEDARALVTQTEAFESRVRDRRGSENRVLRVGAIDSAAAGLVPQFLAILRDEAPEIAVQIIERKTIRLLPRLLSGGLDIAFCRPPDQRDPRIQFRTLFFETAVSPCATTTLWLTAL